MLSNVTSRTIRSFDSPMSIIAKVGLFFVLVFSLRVGAAPTCSGLFSSPDSGVSKYASGAAALAKRLTAPKFDKSKFEEALANYRAAGPANLRQPRTREERLAFLHYAANISKQSPYDLELWARRAKPKDLRRLAKSLGKLNLEKGFSREELNKKNSALNQRFPYSYF